MRLFPHLKGIGTKPGVYKTQGYGEHPEIYIKFGLAFHNGDDYTAPEGTDDYASHDGIVVETGYDPDGYGNYVKYQWDDEDGFTYTMTHAHHKTNLVKVGDRVYGGTTVIGKVGSTGFSTGSHVHRTPKVYKNGVLLNANNGVNGAVDPEKYMVMDFYKIKGESTIVAYYLDKYYEIATKPEDYAYIKGKFGIPDNNLEIGRDIVNSKRGGTVVVGLTFVSS